MADNKIKVPAIKSSKQRRFISGFTLLELLVALTIVVTLVFYALPLFKELVSKSHLEYRKSELLVAIKTAKLAAINHAEKVVICRKGQVNKFCAGALNKGRQNWRHGWLVFLDTNDDKLYQVTEKLLLSKTLIQANCSIDWNRGDYLSYFKFAALQGAAKAGSFVIYCNNFGYKITINWVGRVRVETLIK